MPPNDHRVFTVYRPQITSTSDSGATDILVTHRASSKLTDYKPYTHNSSRPGFSIANQSTIYPIATGQLHISHTTVSLTAYVFHDSDLSDNLFGLAPLINLGYTATYSQTGISIDDSTHHTVIYGTKHPRQCMEILAAQTRLSLCTHRCSPRTGRGIGSMRLRILWISSLPDLL
jgi:hypothetical protein